MRWQSVQGPEALFEGSDPYFQWRRGAGAEAGSYEALRPIVVRLKEDVSIDDFASGTEGAAPWIPHVRVPGFYTRPIPGLEGARWCTAHAEPQFFELLKTNPDLRNRIARIAVLPPIAPQAAGRGAPDPEDADGERFAYPAPDTVVIGIIDYGIAFAHERFRRSERASRIEYMWVQDAPPEDGRRPGLDEDSARRPVSGPDAGWTRAGAEVQPVPYGREISAGSIDRWLSGDGRPVDEDTIYRRTARRLGQRWLRSVSRRVAHGTHVMDLACGYRLDEAEREKRPVVCVQLPEATSADTSGEALDAYALDGIRYVLERADEIARRSGRARLPVVINFSYGNVAGPHDGSSDLEAAIDELILVHRNLDVVIPSGNSHLGRLHAEIAFDEPGQTVELPWRVLPDDRTPSFLEIWLPRDGQKDANRIGLQVRAPGGGGQSEPLDETTPGAGVRLYSGHDQVLCEARYRYVGPPTERGMFLIALQPTSARRSRSGSGPEPIAPPGVWTVTLVNRGLARSDVVEAWIQRDDTPFGFPQSGRQSYFDHPCYERFDHAGRVIEDDRQQADCIIRRAGSMNAIATGREAIVVGGYVAKEQRVARYSAGGPGGRVRWPRRGPDFVAVSDESVIHRGVLAAGTRSGAVAVLDGTSVAAPQIARMVARLVGDSRSPGAVGSSATGPEPGGPSTATITSHVAQLAQPPRPARPGRPKPGVARLGAGLVDPGEGARRKRRLGSTAGGFQPAAQAGSSIAPPGGPYGPRIRSPGPARGAPSPRRAGAPRPRDSGPGSARPRSAAGSRCGSARWRTGSADGSGSRAAG